MPIDDPISALQTIDNNDARLTTPISGIAKQFLSALALLAPPGTEFLKAGFETALVWLETRKEENRKEFEFVLAAEMRYIADRVNRLREEHEEHRRFIAECMPGLLLDGLLKAETIRKKERIARLARVLANAVGLWPLKDADYLEELMTVAVELPDRAIVLLDVAIREFERQQRLGGSQEADEAISARAWGQLSQTGYADIPGDEIASLGARLQSFGLASRIEGITGSLNSYQLLRRGRDFIRYIKSADPSVKDL